MPIPRRLPTNDTTTKKKVIKNPPKVDFDDDEEIEEMEELENEDLEEIDEDVVDEMDEDDEETVEDDIEDDSDEDDEEEDDSEESEDDEEEESEDDSDEETVEDDIEDDSDDEEEEDSDNDSDEDDEETVEDDIEDEDDEEEEEEKPVPKKVNKKNISSKKPAVSKNSKNVAKKTVETKKNTSKTSTTKKTVKPAAVKEEKEENSKKNSMNKVDIIHKNLEEGISNFIEAMNSGKYNNDFDGKTSATRDDLARQVMGKIFESITDEESEFGSKLRKAINFNSLNLASTKAIIAMVESAMMDFIYSQYTFVFGWNEDGNRKSFRRAIQTARPLDGIKDKTGKVYFVKPYPKMKLEFNIGLETVEGKSYDKNTKTFTDLNGKKINLEEENEKFKEEDRKRFPRNYPPHLIKDKKVSSNNKTKSSTTKKTTSNNTTKKKTVKK